MSSNSPQTQFQSLDKNRMPAHVAIIMDGNGRWARKRLLNRIKGHEQGAEAVRTIVRTSREIGISALTLYAFSTENWQRPKLEIHALMTLLERFLRSEKDELIDNNIRLNAIGEIERLPQRTQDALTTMMDLTRQNTGMLLNLALSYGARAELLRMVRQLAEKASSGQISSSAIDEQMISDHLYTRQMPDPDLLIRTSGEMRVSNFLLWQIAYAEIFITETLWPDFSKEEFIRILEDYQGRSRRFGKVGDTD